MIKIEYVIQVKVVVCPAFADSISEGDLRWEKAVGDTVSEDEVLFFERQLRRLIQIKT